MTDVSHMRAALALARRGLGQTWPNPSVGCVIVRDGRVVGRGRTALNGRPHAEPQALAMAGAQARGATAYVTLEPCCFHGRTPPCTEALIAAGIRHVVVGARDPDPRVNGAGLARLRQAGVTVTEAVLDEEASAIIAGLHSRVTTGRPLTTLKLATTLDGRIATATGASRWITGPAARRATHALRGRHDAVLVGIGTVLADDPDLTCRLDGYTAAATTRIVADSQLRLPVHSRLVRSAAAAPVWVLTRDDADPHQAEALRAAGVTLIPVAGGAGGVAMAAGLAALGARGLTSVLIEGGAGVAASLLQADLIDRVAWFHAPMLFGGDGWPAALPFGIASLDAAPRFVRQSATCVGDDMLTEFVRVR